MFFYRAVALHWSFWSKNVLSAIWCYLSSKLQLILLNYSVRIYHCKLCTARFLSWQKKTTNKRRQGMPESLLSKFLRCKLCNCKQMAQQDTNALTASSILEVRNARSSLHGENPLTWLPQHRLGPCPAASESKTKQLVTSRLLCWALSLCAGCNVP